MLKRVLAALAAVICAGAIAWGANIPLLTGPVDPGNLRGTLNTLIQSINANVGGLLNAQTGSVGTAANTAETTLQQYTMPANTLSAAGQSLRITCWGTTGANGNTKTIKLYFGASVISSGAITTTSKSWRYELIVMRTAAATQAVSGSGQSDATPVALYANAGTDALTSGVLIKCTGTNGTASANDIVATGMITEVIK